MTAPASANPVCLTPSSPLDIPPGSLIFYDVIPSNVVSRCSVLACAAGSEGDARLPEAVTLPEFKTWLTAVPWNVRARKSEIDLRSLIVIVKVADVLDDTFISAWVKIVAQRLVRLSLASRESPTDRGTALGQEAAENLAMLPHHVQRQIFAAVADERGSDDGSSGGQPALHLLLDWMPQFMHASIIAATITPEGALTMKLTARSRPFIEALAALPANPPSVLSLTVSGSSWECSHDWAPHHLANALKHHSGLSSLALGNPCMSPEAFAVLSPALTALSAMRSLQLRPRLLFLCGFFCGDSLPGVRAALHSMPQLEALSMAVAFDALTPGFHNRSCLKRPRASSDGGDVLPQNCLVDTLAAATALTSLSIKLDVAGQMHLPIHCSAVPLLHLCSLSITLDSCEWATQFLSRLTAPLTALSFNEISDSSRFGRSDAEKFVIGLAKFTHLRRMRVFPAANRTWSDQALATLLCGVSLELRPLRHLHTVEADVQAPALHAAAPTLRSVFPDLHTLVLTLSNCESTAAQWSQTMQHICSLPLQHVRLTIRSTGPKMSDLVRLAALTALTLNDYSYEDLATDTGVSALGQMSQLQHIHLMGHPAETTIRWKGLLPRLAALPGLTTLVIEGRQMSSDALAAREVATAWPALRQLGLAIGCVKQKDVLCELVRAAGALPCLKSLVLGNDREGEEQFDGSITGGLKACLTEIEGDEGMSIADQLQQIARRAGVALSFQVLRCLRLP